MCLIGLFIFISLCVCLQSCLQIFSIEMRNNPDLKNLLSRDLKKITVYDLFYQYPYYARSSLK